jgi:AraC-like DNA-binding protein
MLAVVTDLLDIVVRSTGVAFGVVLMLAVAARGGWRQRADLLAVVGCVCAYLVCAAPSRPCCASPGTLPVALGAVGFPFAFWRLARVALADDRRIAPWAWAALALLLGSGIVAAVDYLGTPAPWRVAAGAVNKVVAFGLLASALVAAWRSRDGDLVEPRRELRGRLVAFLGAYGLAILVVEVFLLGQPAPLWLETANAAVIDVMLLAVLLHLVGVRAQSMDALFAPAPQPSAAESPPPPQRAADEPLLDRLRALMDEGKAYRDPELSVRGLAQRLAVPEHVLRRLINERLGHRNFAAFVNEYRLREVSERLADRAVDRRPILTLALESGFGSIGPFNRAFRERYGVTPTQFRAAHAASVPAH